MQKTLLVFITLLFLFSCEENGEALDESLIGSWSLNSQTMSQDVTVNQNVQILDMWNPMENSFTVSITDSSNLTTDTFNLDYITIEENDYCSLGGYEDNCIEFEFTNISQMESNMLMNATEYELNCLPDLSACRTTFVSFADNNFFYYYDSSGESSISFWDENAFDMIYDYTFESYPSIYIAANNNISVNPMSVSAGNTFFFRSAEFVADEYLYSIITFNEDGTVDQSTVADCGAIEPDDDWDCTDLGCAPVYYGNMLTGCESMNCEEITEEFECYNYGYCDWNYNENACVDYDDYYDGPDMTWSTNGNTLSLTQTYGLYSMVQTLTYEISGSDLMLSQSISVSDYYNNDEEMLDSFFENISNDIYGLSKTQISDLIESQYIYASSYSGPTILNENMFKGMSPLLKPKFKFSKNIKRIK